MISQKEKAAQAYTAFWTWFQSNAAEFYRVIKTMDDAEVNFLDKIIPRLQTLNKNFLCLVGMIDGGIAEMVITVDGSIQDIPFVEELVASAPTVEGWLFTASKPVVENIGNFDITIHGYTFNAKTLSFYAKATPACPDRIDIVIVHQDYQEAREGELLHGAFLYLDNYLGELNVVTIIDMLSVGGKSKAGEELIPITKLKSFLKWRQKEFEEKHNAIKSSSEKDGFTVFQAITPERQLLLATFNQVLLDWDKTPSYPWIVDIAVTYTGDSHQALLDIDDELIAVLPESEGILYIGRKTIGNKKNVYFACKDFRKPAFALREFIALYEESDFYIEYRINKDKYWNTFDVFRKK